MLAAGALAFAVDVAFFSPPPHRPERPERRTKGAVDTARNVIRAVRRELDLATDDSVSRLPQVGARYPY